MFHLKRNVILIYRISLVAKKIRQWTFFFENHVGYGFFYRVLMFPNKIGMATKDVGYFCQISLF